MKIRRTNSFGEPTRRRNPLSLIVTLVPLVIVAALGWAWHQGGEKPMTHVEKPIAADKLGH